MSPMPEAPQRFVSIPEFVKRSSLSRGTVYNLIAAGQLPRPTRLSSNRVAFPHNVVEEFFASKVRAA